MTLGPDFRSSADMVREAAEEDARREFEAYQEQRLVESVEAMEAHWSRVFVQQAKELPCDRDVYPSKPGYDRRLFGGEAS